MAAATGTDGDHVIASTGGAAPGRDSSDYRLTGPKWANVTVTWSNATDDFASDWRESTLDVPLSASHMRIMRDAFDAWEEVCGIDFVEVADGADVNIRVGAGYLDGPGGTAGRATWRYAGNDLDSTRIVFENEQWDPIDFFDVALHEIGHVIGIAHSDVENTVLSGPPHTAYADPNPGGRDQLTPDDIAAAQELYGPPGTTPAPPTPPDPTPTPPTPTPPTPVPPTPVPPAPPGQQGIAVTGGEEADTLEGGAGADLIEGWSGNDTIYGMGGDDTIYGDDGDDELYGGDGDDEVHGGDGDDDLHGGDGDDLVDGYDGDNTLRGGAGDDTLRGEAGNDVFEYDLRDGGHDTFFFSVEDVVQIRGLPSLTYTRVIGASTQAGDDVLMDLTAFGGGTIRFVDTTIAALGADRFTGLGTDGPAPDTPAPALPTPNTNPDATERGGAGNDTINGGTGNDNVYGEGGDDALLGGEGDDYIDGGAGDDRLWGQAGDDGIDGGTGDDLVFGEAGNDTIAGGEGDDVILSGEGDDAVAGGDGFDRVWGGGGADTLHGGAGRNFLAGDEGGDFIYGGDGADVVIAGSGNDSVSGRGGDDRIIGGTGNDTIHGGAGRNYLNGSDGDDSITGGADRDYLDGEGGNDTLVGGGARDVLAGGAGNDSLVGGDEGDTFFGQAGADVFDVTGGRNWIMDFEEADRLDVGMNLGQLQAAATQLGADLHVALAGGGDLYLANTALADIEADNLIA